MPLSETASLPDFLARSSGDAVNVVFAAAEQNLCLRQAWLIRLVAFPLSPIAIGKHALALLSAQPAAH